MAKGKKKSDKEQQAALEKEQRSADTDVIEEPAADEELRRPDGARQHVDLTREEIMAKSKARRNKQKAADTEQLDDDGKRLQEAMEAEARGELNEFDTEYEAPKPGEEPAGDEKPTETVDSDPDVVTIKVDGEEREVPRADIEKAGVAALQKESAADKRLKEASEYELSLKSLEASLQKQIEDLQTQQPVADGSAAGDDPANLPDEGAVAEAVAEQAAKVAEAIYSGDEDQVKEGLIAALTSVVPGRQSSTPPLDAKQFAQDIMENMRRDAAEKEQAQQAEERSNVAKTVNSTFEEEFPDLYADDRGFRLTKAEFDGLCAEKPNADRVVLMREAAGTVNQLVNPPVDDEISRRKNRKRGADADAPSSAQRMKPGKPEAKKTRADVVADMQRQRGQRSG